MLGPARSTSIITDSKNKTRKFYKPVRYFSSDREDLEDSEDHEDRVDRVDKEDVKYREERKNSEDRGKGRAWGKVRTLRTWGAGRT